MGERQRAGRRIVAFAGAVALHAALLSVYLTTRPAPEQRTELRSVEVWLAPLPRRPNSDPTREPVRPQARVRAAEPTEPRKPPDLDATTSAIAPEWRVGEPGVSGPVRLGGAATLLHKCLETTADERVREGCEKMWGAGRQSNGGERPPHFVSRTAGQEAGYARTVRKKEAFRTYRQTGSNYPGLRCAFGRDCEPKEGPP